ESTGESRTPAHVDEAAGQYRVIRIVDGDTVIIEYRGTTRVRLIGIDTPEVDNPYGPAECWGQHASRAAEELLSGASVKLSFNPNGDRRDQYDRLLAYITLPNGKDYGEIMLRRGHADLFYSAYHPREDRYRAVKTKAKKRNRGLWGQC